MRSSFAILPAEPPPATVPVTKPAAQPPKPRQRAVLIRSREPAVANDICDQNRRVLRVPTMLESSGVAQTNIEPSFWTDLSDDNDGPQRTWPNNRFFVDRTLRRGGLEWQLCAHRGRPGLRFRTLAPLFAMFCRRLDQCPLRTVNPISGSHWNAGFRPHSGPSRGDPCRRALRPFETFSQTSQATDRAHRKISH